MAVITRFIIVRNGIELDKVFDNKKEADAYDKMLDAAENLAEFIKNADLQINIDAKAVDDIAIYLAKNGPEVTRILKGIKPSLPPAAAATEKPIQARDALKAPIKKTAAKPKAK